jgi:hypothetical protein
MQPHVNLGIRFRTHFEPRGFSKKRSYYPLRHRIRGLYLLAHRGILKMSVARRSVNEAEGLITAILSHRKVKRLGRHGKGAAR